MMEATPLAKRGDFLLSRHLFLKLNLTNPTTPRLAQSVGLLNPVVVSLMNASHGSRRIIIRSGPKPHQGNQRWMNIQSIIPVPQMNPHPDSSLYLTRREIPPQSSLKCKGDPLPNLNPQLTQGRITIQSMWVSVKASHHLGQSYPGLNGTKAEVKNSG